MGKVKKKRKRRPSVPDTLAGRLDLACTKLNSRARNEEFVWSIKRLAKTSPFGGMYRVMIQTPDSHWLAIGRVLKDLVDEVIDAAMTSRYPA